MHASGYKTAANMGTYFGKNYQGSYLAGIAAGKMTKKNHLGYVGAFPISEVIYNLNAFTLGAQSVNPEVKVDVVWTNTWYDPATERQAALSLLDKGADVLLAYQDSPATLQAASERGAFAGGNDSDMGKYAPDHYLTNPVWNWGPYYVKAVKSVMDGTWKSEQYSGDIADGMVGLAPFGSKVRDDVKKLVEDAKAKIISGELDVFTGPISDNQGKVQVQEGQKLTLEEVLAMNWLAKGIEGTIPK
jgi:basic membrane protein A